MQPLIQKFQTYLFQRSDLNKKGSVLKGSWISKRTDPIVAGGRSDQKGFVQNIPGVKEIPTPGMKSPKGPTLPDLTGTGPTISPSSIKNYISDINHFLNFIAASIQEPIVQPVHITPAAIKAYSASAAVQLSPSSLNRHLSSLRYFGKFLLSAKLCETDPAQNLANPAFDPTLAQIITRYQKFLKLEDLSKSTVKNYLSDLKKYLLWARKNIKTTDESLIARSLN